MIFVCGMIYEEGKNPVPIVYNEQYKIGLASDSHVISKLSHDACPLRVDAPVLEDGVVVCCKDGIYTCIDEVWSFDDAPVIWSPEMEYIGHLMSTLFKSSGQFIQSGFVQYGKFKYEILSSANSDNYYFLTPELNSIVVSDKCRGIHIPMNLKTAEELVDRHKAEALIWTDKGIHILQGDGKGVFCNPNPNDFTYEVLTGLNYMSMSYTDFDNIFRRIYIERGF